MKWILLAILLSLSCCLSEEEQLAGAKRCTDAGLIPDIRPYFVECTVPREK